MGWGVGVLTRSSGQAEGHFHNTCSPTEGLQGRKTLTSLSSHPPVSCQCLPPAKPSRRQPATVH